MAKLVEDAQGKVRDILVGSIGWDGEEFHVLPAAEEYATNLRGLLARRHRFDPESGRFIMSEKGERWFRLLPVEVHGSYFRASDIYEDDDSEDQGGEEQE